MALLRHAEKFDPFLSLDCAPTPSTLAQSKERKGSNFAIWQPWLCPSPSSAFLPSSEQTAMTVSKVLVEKSTLLSMYLRSGSWIRSVLCIGVKWMRASAVMLYRSSVLKVNSKWDIRVSFLPFLINVKASKK